jgi:hypothetical protein
MTNLADERMNPRRGTRWKVRPLVWWSLMEQSCTPWCPRILAREPAAGTPERRNAEYSIVALKRVAGGRAPLGSRSVPKFDLPNIKPVADRTLGSGFSTSLQAGSAAM